MYATARRYRRHVSLAHAHPMSPDVRLANLTQDMLRAMAVRDVARMRGDILAATVAQSRVTMFADIIVREFGDA